MSGSRQPNRPACNPIRRSGLQEDPFAIWIRGHTKSIITTTVMETLTLPEILLASSHRVGAIMKVKTGELAIRKKMGL